MLFKLQNISFNFRNFALKNISFELKKGEILGIIGESGSGKTLLSLRILGLLDGVCESKGEIIFNGARVESMQKFLGKEITYIPQEPLVALNPLHKIKKQVCEILMLHNPKMSKSALDSRFCELMQMVDLDLKFSEVYPYQLSGGQRQRVLMAMALANNPKIIIADEPTTALDSVLQKQILDLLRDLSKKLEIAVILITHNIAVVGHYADKILPLKNGEVMGNLSLGMQSAGFANEVKQPFRTCENFGDFADPKSSLNPQNFHKYKSHTANTSIVCNAESKIKNAPCGSILDEKSGLRSHEQENRTDGSLTKRVASLPDLSPKDNAQNLQNPYLRDLFKATHFSYKNANLSDEILLKVQKLSVFQTEKKRLFGKNTTKKTLHNINFELKKGEILGIIGESGSGKSTLALALLNLIKYNGDIIFGTQNYKEIRNFRAFRKHIQIVFQDSNSSLNGRFRVRDIIKEGLDIHFKRDISKGDKDKKVAEILRFVGLDSSNLSKFPHELSGGQRQRIAIARALILNPQILILDEPTSALDKITQKQVLELLLGLKDEFGLSYILITHDLGIIDALCDNIIVLKGGEIVEKGNKFMLKSPKNLYTKSLVESIL